MIAEEIKKTRGGPQNVASKSVFFFFFVLNGEKISFFYYLKIRELVC